MEFWTERRGSYRHKCGVKFIPANFFEVMGVRFLSWECWDFEDDTNKSKDSQRRPKSSQDSGRGNSPDISQSQFQDVYRLTRPHSQCFLFEEGSIAIYALFLHQFEFTYFCKLCQAKLQPLTFFIWCENLACMRENEVFNLHAERVGR